MSTKHFFSFCKVSAASKDFSKSSVGGLHSQSSSREACASHPCYSRQGPWIFSWELCSQTTYISPMCDFCRANHESTDPSRLCCRCLRERRENWISGNRSLNQNSAALWSAELFAVFGRQCCNVFWRRQPLTRLKERKPSPFFAKSSHSLSEWNLFLMPLDEFSGQATSLVPPELLFFSRLCLFSSALPQRSLL